MLYNLKDDIGETTDLASTKRNVFEKMKNELKMEYENLLDGSHIWGRKE